LSEISHISVRSIQRIENGEIIPRSHTLKTLSGLLELPWPEVKGAGETLETTTAVNKQRKMILSFSIPSLLILGTLAFVSQSSGFPETFFEFLALVFAVVSLSTFVLWMLWRDR
jgi:hypothetical protein